MKTRHDVYNFLAQALSNPKVVGVKVSVAHYVALVNLGCADLLLLFSYHKPIHII